ncbi:M4 family metallopeptidase [Neorhizobium sp. NCHU2750]|uniref:M4 family metallopeptidase n=1 Tax=Neorhizobium sp. NCHU2750 TaxID=1825976 RepID=UPI001FE1AC20
MDSKTRASLRRTALLDLQTRLLRAQAQQFTTSAVGLMGLPANVAASPKVTVYDCQNTTSIPGKAIEHPEKSKDGAVRATFDNTTGVASFFKDVFGRNSLDDAGMTLRSSVHYGEGYNNAFWNGSQMTYGDGDGEIFIELCKGSDVVAHELMHGVTQYTLQLVYENESGGLNESLSDVFGSMFRQWLNKETVDSADWLIGADILGTKAKSLGYDCLRNMADPESPKCLGRQISHYDQYRTGMDPHESSGVANLAFYKIAMALKGHSWDEAGQVWYNVVSTWGSSPNMTMQQFADATLHSAQALYPKKPAVAAAVHEGWDSVGLRPTVAYAGRKAMAS